MDTSLQRIGFIVCTQRWALTVLTLIGLTLLVGCAADQFEQRDQRFYYRALWNYSLRNEIPELDSEFNGVDFGHSYLYENLLRTGGHDVAAIEGTARQDTLRFIYSRPTLPPNEEAIAPTYFRLAWRAQNTFNEAHALHRATYDLYTSDMPDKGDALQKVIAYYQQSPYALTAHPLDHGELDRFPYSKGFRQKFPLFNATIWAYHYLQIGVYDPLAAGATFDAKRAAVTPILTTYHHYLKEPQVQWTFMPLTAEYSPKFAADYPELKNIFDNLHMLHDNISDILVSDLFPIWDAKREEIYRILDTYYLAKADATNPMIMRGHGHEHGTEMPSSPPAGPRPHQRQ